MHFTLEAGIIAALPLILLAILCLLLVRGQIASLKSSIEKNTAECQRQNASVKNEVRRTK